MDIDAHFDSTPIMMELFKTEAYLHAFVDTILTEEQKKAFNKSYLDNLKSVILEFSEDFPDAIEDLDKLREKLK